MDIANLGVNFPEKNTCDLYHIPAQNVELESGQEETSGKTNR